MRVLTPYRAQAPESGAHLRLGAFDWERAMQLLAASVRASCGCDTVALTDDDSGTGGLPAIRLAGGSPRLMLWIVEASLRYLDSSLFTEDTVLVSPDTLVMGALRPFFRGDLTLLVRPHPKYHNRPILNAVQWWPVASRPRLVRFYREALALAEAMPDNLIQWGADSQCLRQLLEPMGTGVHRRAGLDVFMCPAHTVLQTITTGMTDRVLQGRHPGQGAAVVDFKGTRKHYMAQYAEALGVRA